MMECLWQILLDVYYELYAAWPHLIVGVEG